MKVLVKKTLSGLKPVYASDVDIYNKISLDEEFEIDYKRVRNAKFHRKFFKLIQTVFENQEKYRVLDELREDLTIAAGYHYEHINYLTGEVKIKAKSISYASMDDVEFSELYNAVIDQIVLYFHFEKQDLIDHIEQFF